ncbi:MAG: RimK family alpha-L-glutamate ligase [Deltaproteobacteria bacterium]|nr:RimK family alpha-L-glutamate ligase [Deltaproteobacteria bacterium]MBW2015331.1 RimK family alpha-L-glutamate ligase [Deltaproteobacteria bacterium]MBW2128192.1 RimK family alpha-L-glutamate ligase [Deltaproteobacteria bacterium]MBW2303091.1 RimK family alpha-L-glutamate ligase [Deltaproteobacteria bacterium]
MNEINPSFVALGNRLKGVPEVITLGLKPNFHDYSSRERSLIFRSPLILYPTLNYAQFFSTIGKRIFPSLENHLYADEKIKQTTLFYMLGLPHPRTRIYYGSQCREILKDFSPPFIAKLPRASSRGMGVFFIEGIKDLEAYLDRTRVAYIQEYIPHERDLRVILINGDPVLAYWRYSPSGGFKTNVSQGGRISFESVPDQALELARKAAQLCNFDDVGLDLILHENRWYLIEANMKYGLKGAEKKGMKIRDIIRKKLLSGEIGGSVSHNR